MFNFLLLEDDKKRVSTLEGTRSDKTYSHLYVSKFYDAPDEKNIFIQINDKSDSCSVWITQEEFDDWLSRLVELNKQYKEIAAKAK